MKKTNNKGFSLVELIIVIAIMAILAGAIAPALIRYIDKSRKSNDVTAAKTIKTAVETALGNESVYEYLTTGSADACLIYVEPGASTATTTTATVKNGVSIVGAYSGTEKINDKTATQLYDIACKEIGTNIGEKTPKLKYKKNASGSGTAPTQFVAVVSKKGTVYVFISTQAKGNMPISVNQTTGEVTSSGNFQICPNVCDEYQ